MEKNVVLYLALFSPLVLRFQSSIETGLLVYPLCNGGRGRQCAPNTFILVWSGSKLADASSQRIKLDTPQLDMFQFFI